MMSWWTVGAAPFLGLGIGIWTAHHAARLGYRYDTERELPHPGRRRWIIAAAVLGWALAAVGSAVTGLPWLPLLALLVCGPYLAAIDLDVRRLPNRIIFPALAATFGCVAVLSAWTHSWIPLLTAALYTLGLGGFLWLLWRFSRGGLGFGDVKLGLLLGAALCGHSWAAPFLTVLVGNLAALVVMLAGRRRDLALGPCLIAAAAVANLLP